MLHLSSRGHSFRNITSSNLKNIYFLIINNSFKSFLSKSGRCCATPNKGQLIYSNFSDLPDIYRSLPKIQQNTLKKRIDVLVNAGFKLESILENSEILLKSDGATDNLIRILREISLNDEAILLLLTWEGSSLNRCINACRRDLKTFPEHRINFLVNALDSQEETIVTHLQKYHFIFSLSLAQIRGVVEILLQNEIRACDILNDPWVLRCKIDRIRSRFVKLDEAGVENRKPWMARCVDDVFNKFITRASTKQKLLGESSLEEYLSQRLGCSADDMKELIDREPQLQKTSVMKMKKILDFLFASGFEAGHILAGLPRVANRRIETIHTRLLEINQLGIPPSLYVLCKSEKEYQNYVNKRKAREN